MLQNHTKLMPTVYLASYKGTRQGLKGLTSRLIRVATKSIYSHTELCVGHPFNGPVDCLSAERRPGVRIKRMALAPAKWDLIPLPTLSADSVHAFYAQYKGQRYDLIGTVRTLLPFVGREHADKWFCSEVAAHVMGYPEAWRMHPGVLHAVATKY